MNLWTEFDNHEQHADATGFTNMRRLTEHTILSSLRDWLLRDYVAAYCRSLAATRIFRRCYWIDALGIDSKANISTPPTDTKQANTKQNGRGHKKVPNAPPMLQPVSSLSHLLMQESKPITLHGLLLDAGNNKSRNKRSMQNGTLPTTKVITIPKESGIIRASWLEAATPLLKEVEQSPTIFLLNPFSPLMFSYDDIAQLYQRTVPTELCLFVSHKQLETCLLAARRIPEQATILTGLLRTDRWKTLPTEEDESAQALDGLLALFMAAMQRNFLLPVQRIALPMQIRPALVENVPYTVVFATRRQDSMMGMNDAVCLRRRLLNEQSRRGVLSEEWFAQQAQQRLRADLQQLYQRALQQGRTQRIRRWPDLRQQLMLANFGQFSIQDYDAIMRQLLLSGQVRCEWRQRLPAEEGRIPSSEDALQWT